jgi:hypothetical protein
MMSVKEKIALMVTVVVLMLAVMVFARLSDDALGMLVGVCIGLSVAVPALGIVAWVAGRSYADQQHHQDQEYREWQKLQHHRRQAYLEDRQRAALPRQVSRPRRFEFERDERQRRLPPQIIEQAEPYIPASDAYWHHEPHSPDYPRIDFDDTIYPEADEADMW